jgi:hypothetical protein
MVDSFKSENYVVMAGRGQLRTESKVNRVSKELNIDIDIDMHLNLEHRTTEHSAILYLLTVLLRTI